MKVDLPDAGQLRGVRAQLIALPAFDDHRGSLLPIDFASLPFAPCRLCIVKEVPPGTVRGGHAHRVARQLLVCLTGRVDVQLRDSGQAQKVSLDSTRLGLLVEAGVWASQTYVLPDSILLVLASEPYDPASYLPDDAP